jgi:hypothetical protein
MRIECRPAIEAFADRPDQRILGSFDREGQTARLRQGQPNVIGQVAGD